MVMVMAMVMAMAMAMAMVKEMAKEMATVKELMPPMGPSKLHLQLLSSIPEHHHGERIPMHPCL
jgi:hypothetical protein